MNSTGTDGEASRRDRILQRCWDKALYAFATAHIFERRYRSLKCKLRLLTFLGIAVPLTVGGIALTFGAGNPLMPYVLVAAGVLGIAQLIMSGWALVASWHVGFADAGESISINHSLSEKYKSLASDPPDTLEDLRTRFEFINIENKERENLDHRKAITEEEKRAGHRAALRQFQRACVACNEVPTSLDPTDCPTCGQF